MSYRNNSGDSKRQPTASDEGIASTDFINLTEPPRPKETPTISEYDNRVPVSTDTQKHQPFNFQRRRSTNYIDALNSKQKRTNSNAEKYNNDIATKPSHLRRKSSMSLQDTRHDIQNKETNLKFHQNHKNADMGDYLQHYSFRNPSGDTDLPRTMQLSEDDDGRNILGNNDQRPIFHERRPSFQYEDYKKDIYNRMNIFDTK
ncbi:hypothetical protein KAFR_0C04420 [Kazachstania africana CBS 2517]|uniref:Uncharacterized protein n=1 Tax=Kazachstania africana (strain ATCC 22294 / BCRC 22015 / CBS 2517 / CECT 1963 / NBRC 1671 / NRRL Y-8276) TaxID=1071382 RepID=H2AST2_KAZAF|nr:hypothetical protein KAFR_0C04420 [Kazachstania africana CBS 2517]CCF57432.1 hypothetical protein KAFR_0C04420 [Kazachstania africana CBS 2517]